MPSYGLDSGLDPLNNWKSSSCPKALAVQIYEMKLKMDADRGSNDLILTSKIVLISVRLCNSILAAQLLLGIFAIFSFFLKVSQHV